ncbi:MAG: nucleoside 2-deoxyribosyltransferase [Candidatus Aminicenantes bacterium]|nr:nucleoside 2-deoxyribosyltransferase [Acidobacteriota bacterium]MCG2812717.1 nucleoside 2-deoxyribosyltransferase [Candidatus Aminicenantes bacterium]
MEKCSICLIGKISKSKVTGFQKSEIICEICGTYIATEETESWLKTNSEIQNNKYILSGIIRNQPSSRNPIEISTSKIDSLIESARIQEDPLEAIDKIILYIFNKSTNKAHDSFIQISTNDYPIAYAKNQNEFLYYLTKAVDLKFIERHQSNEYRLTIPIGWQRVSELKKIIKLSKQAFVAMWFDSSLNEIWEKAFKPALKQTGFNPIRMDKTEHNERIDDKIIADIRKSALLVADLTEHRQGVYFEAGFSLGLGIPVIWTCRDDHKDKIHFDTRQYNCIFWKTPEELKERLINRIEATIPFPETRVNPL